MPIPWNNPYIPGDPYSYDLKWIVSNIKQLQEENNIQFIIDLISEYLKNGNKAVSPEMFGAKGDGVTDDTAALQAAIDTGLPVVAVNEYQISSISIPSGTVAYINRLKSLTAALKIDGNYSCIAVNFISAPVCMILGENKNSGNNFIFARYMEFSDVGIKIDITGTRAVTNNRIVTGRLRAFDSGSFANYGLFMRTNSDAYANANLFNISSIQYCNSAVYMEALGNYTMNNNIIEDLDPENCTMAFTLCGKLATNKFMNIRSEEFTTSTFAKLIGNSAANIMSISSGLPAASWDLSELTGPAYYSGTYFLKVEGQLLTPSGGILYEDFKIGMGNAAPYIAPLYMKNKWVANISQDTIIDIDEPTPSNFAANNFFRGSAGAQKTLTLNESFGYQRIDTFHVYAASGSVPLKVIDAGGRTILNDTSTASANLIYTIRFIDRYYVEVDLNSESVSMTNLP